MEKKENRNNVSFIILGLFILLYTVTCNYLNKLNKQKFLFFYHFSINSIITYVDKNQRTDNFKISSNDTLFKFYSLPNLQLNENTSFQNLAAPGDSVYKPSKSDTLILIKKGKRYYYMFQKFNM